MLIKELNPLDVKIGDKLVNYHDFSDVYTVDKITIYGFDALTTLVILGMPVVGEYDAFGIQLSHYTIEEKIKLVYTKQLSRLIQL